MISYLRKSRTRSIVYDWVVLSIILVLLGITALISPFERQFKLDDITISHPYKGDTVPMIHLVVFSLIGCLVIITAFQFYKNNLRYNYHQALIGLLLALSISTLFSHFIKIFVGRYRPDFISVCNVDFARVQEIYNSYDISSSFSYGPRNLFNTSICLTAKEDLNEERKSFPSGHSSFSFSVMSYLSLYIAGQIHLLDKKSYLWKYFVVSIPYFIAIFVATSRVFDYRHHWQDVTVGGIIGLFFGVVTYFYYFPSLGSPVCYIPYQRYDYCQENDRTEFTDDLTV